MKMLVRSFCVVLFLLCNPVSFADLIEVPRLQTLSLASLTDHVSQGHPQQLKAAVQQQKIAENDQLANAILADTATLNFTHNNDMIGSSDGFQEWEGSVDLPLWLKGQKQQQILLSDTLAAELPAYKQHIRLAASGMVRDAVWSVIQVEQALLQVVQQLKASKRLEQDIQNRIQAGELAATQALLMQAHSIELQRQFLAKSAELDYAKEHYFRLSQQSALPNEYEEQVTSKTSIDSSHPLLALQLQKMDTLRIQQSLAKYEGATNSIVSVGVRRERGGHDEDFNHSLILGFSLPLDNERYQQKAISAAAMDLTEAQIELHHLERNLIDALSRQQASLESKKNQLSVLKQHYQTTKQYLDIQTRAFELGEIDLVSLLRSQTLANESRLQLLSLQIDIKQSIAKVNQALGISL